MGYKEEINRLSPETIRGVISALITYRSKMYVYDRRVDNKINELTRSYLSLFGIIKQ
jgi:hypothetical protein